MDSSKVKNILIAIYIVLNIFLLVNIGFAKSGEDVTKNSVSKTAVKILQDRGITLLCDMPKYSGNNARIEYQNDSYDRDKISNALLGKSSINSKETNDGIELISGNKRLTFKNTDTLIYEDSSPKDNVNISDVRAVEKFVRKFCSNIGLPLSSYYIDKGSETATSNSRNIITLIFTEKHSKYLIYDSYIKVVVSKDGITYLESSLKKVKSILPADNKIISAHQLLLENYVKGMETVIVGVDIGFKEQDSEGSYGVLVWRITTKDNNIRYFVCTNGEEIRP